jgi:hypothetical protein
MLTVAIRGPLAAKMRQFVESTGMSLAKLLRDALLVYEGEVNAGYEPGTSLRRWQESRVFLSNGSPPLAWVQTCGSQVISCQAAHYS